MSHYLEKPPMRFWIAVMIFMTTFTNYMYRSGISVSLVSMTHNEEENATHPCLNENDTAQKIVEESYDPTYGWSEYQQALILSSYFWGYLITILPGGLLAETVGPWNVILWSNVAALVTNALTPTVASYHYIAVIACRVLIGLLGGLGYPALNHLIAEWAPPEEKGRFMAAMMGNTMGTAITWMIVGSITKATKNWAWGFYILDILQGCFCVLFAIVVSNSPTKHRWISEEEKNYIIEKQAGTVTATKALPPYKSILSSRPFWAATAAQFGSLWGLNMFLTYTPKFLVDTLGFDIQSAGILSGLPQLARLIFAQIFGYAGDKMRIKGLMSLSQLRKFFIIFSHFVPALFLLFVMGAGCNYKGIIPLLVLTQAFNGAVVVSHLITPQDIAPNFAGSIFGIMNLVAGTCGIIIPQISAAFTKAYNRKIEGSYWIFSIGAIMYFASGAMFMLFGSAEIQSWNEKKADKKDYQHQPET